MPPRKKPKRKQPPTRDRTVQQSEVSSIGDRTEESDEVKTWSKLNPELHGHFGDSHPRPESEIAAKADTSRSLMADLKALAKSESEEACLAALWVRKLCERYPSFFAEEGAVAEEGSRAELVREANDRGGAGAVSVGDDNGCEENDDGPARDEEARHDGNEDNNETSGNVRPRGVRRYVRDEDEENDDGKGPALSGYEKELYFYASDMFAYPTEQTTNSFLYERVDLIDQKKGDVLATLAAGMGSTVWVGESHQRYASFMAKQPTLLAPRTNLNCE